MRGRSGTSMLATRCGDKIYRLTSSDSSPGYASHFKVQRHMQSQSTVDTCVIITARQETSVQNFNLYYIIYASFRNDLLGFASSFSPAFIVLVSIAPGPFPFLLDTRGAARAGSFSGGSRDRRRRRRWRSPTNGLVG